MLARLGLTAPARVVRSVALLALIVCGVLIAGSQPAAAQLVDRSREHVQDTFQEEVCGLSVITTLDFFIIEKERIGQSGFPLFMLTRHGTVTWTNPETGKSVTSQFAGSVKDVSVTDNGDGTITVRTALNGIAEFLRSDGTRLLMDVGRVVFVDVLDYNGTPTDVEDDELISSDVESVSGPHPDLDSDGELFCETLVAALT